MQNVPSEGTEFIMKRGEGPKTVRAGAIKWGFPEVLTLSAFRFGQQAFSVRHFLLF
jgi:hypothetical protein